LVAASVHCVSGYCVINNGEAPPNPDNIIDDATYSGNYAVYVRNVGCPPGWPTVSAEDPCPSPGAGTEAVVEAGADAIGVGALDSSAVTMSGGVVWILAAGDSGTATMSGGTVLLGLGAADSSTVTMSGGSTFDLKAADSSTVTMSGGGSSSLQAHDTSNFTMSGGSTFVLEANGSSTITMSGGWVGALHVYGSSTVAKTGGGVGGLHAHDSSTVTMSGGTVLINLTAFDSSTIMIVGSGFKVDGVPVPYDDLTATTGTLTGTLASGNPIDNEFYQGGGNHTGTIRLIPAVVSSVAIDVGPGDPENEISGGRRVPIQVAILGSAEFDVRDVDVTTLRFGPGEASPALDLTHPFTYWLSLRDVNGDGEDDLVPVFLYGDTELPLGESDACLTGEIASASFEACDTVRVLLPECGRGFELALLLPPLMWLRGRRRRAA
jgi:hypothetical protein